MEVLRHLGQIALSTKNCCILRKNVTFAKDCDTCAKMGNENKILFYYRSTVIFRKVGRKTISKNMNSTVSLLTVYFVSSQVRAQPKSRTLTTTNTRTKSASQRTFAVLDLFSRRKNWYEEVTNATTVVYSLLRINKPAPSMMGINRSGRLMHWPVDRQHGLNFQTMSSTSGTKGNFAK